MTCQNCGKPLEGQNPRQRFCGGRCRAAASRKQREMELMAALTEAHRAIETAQQLVVGVKHRGWLSPLKGEPIIRPRQFT